MFKVIELNIFLYNFQAPPLEIFKTKAAKTLIAGAGPHVSIQGSSGIIPGPSDEPVHNSLEGDIYSSTTTAPATPTYKTSTLRYDSSPAVNYHHASTGVEFSTLAPSTHTGQTTGIQFSAQNYPSSSEEQSNSYLGAVESQSQQYYQGVSSGSTGYSTTEKYNAYAGVNSEDSSRNEYESKQQNYYGGQVSTGSQGYSSTSSETLREYTAPSSRENYESSLRPSYSTSTQNNEQSSSYSEAQTGHQITSYLADSSAAVDVTGTGRPLGLPGVSEYSPNTRISAVLVAEEGNRYEENEIRHEYGNRYVSSTTPNPIKTLLKPIVVSDAGGVSSPLALYSAYGQNSNERYITNTIGKLYHREGSLKTHGGYSSTAVSVEPNSQEYYNSTPPPTPEPVLVTPRLEASRLTSSGNILAPIQAGLSISANHNLEDCDENSATYQVKENIPSTGPDIEKQELKEEAVYKTTVDIQKSIPFEIHPNQPYYPNEPAEQQLSEPEEHSHQTAEVQTEYRDQSSNSLHSQVGNIQIGQHSQEGYEQQSQEEHSDSVQSNYQTQASSGHTENEYSSEVNANSDNNRNNFLQQVLFAYHKMANNHQNNPYIAADGGGYQTGIPVQNQPLFVPNKLYYVYMQRFNPYANRYGTLYTNYRPTPTQAPLVPEDSSYTHGESTAQVDQSGQYQSQRYLGEHNVNINNVGYGGYASQGGHHGHETSGTASSIAYSNQVGGTQFSSASGQSAFENVNMNYAQHAGNINVSPSYSEETRQYDSSQNTAQEYATQLNALSISSGGGGVASSGEQQVQYSTGQEGERQEVIPENYQQGSSSFQQVDTVGGQSTHGRYTSQSDNSFNQNTNILLKQVSVPHYVETTKLVEVERPVPFPHPVPVEYTNIVEKPVPYVHQVPVHHTQYVEKPVPVPQPVPIEVTRIVEKPVPVPHPVPVEYTKVLTVEKPVAVPHPVPYAVTKLVAVDRPVAFPQPVPFPYPVPHPVGVPVPHLVPYPSLVPVPVKDYRSLYVYRKPSGARLLHRDGHYHHQVKHAPAFRPSQPMFGSQYPPQTYEVTAYFKGPHVKGRGHGRKLCIEYGGFKPPMVPSVQIETEPKPTYGPPAEEKKD